MKSQDRKLVLIKSDNVPSIEIVTLENYWNCVDKSYARELMGEIHLLRRMGYGPDYPKHFLPFDTTDLFCVHYLFFEVQGQSRNLVGGFRQVTLSSCDYFQMELPLVDMVKKENAEPQIAYLKNLVSKFRSERKDLIYSSALTIKKENRQNKVLSKLILELVPALTVFDMKRLDIQMVVGAAAIRFKTDRVFQSWGYKPFEVNGVELPPFARHSLDENNNFALALTLTQPSAYALDCYDRHKQLIENRQIVSGDQLDQLKVA